MTSWQDPAPISSGLPGTGAGRGQEAADSLSHGYFGAAWGSVDCQPQPSNQSRPGRESTWPRLPAQPPPPLSCTWGQGQLRPAPRLSEAQKSRGSLPLSLEIKVHSYPGSPPSRPFISTSKKKKHALRTLYLFSLTFPSHSKPLLDQTLNPSSTLKLHSCSWLILLHLVFPQSDIQP